MDVASTIRPGQIWLIEQRAATSLAALDRGALAAADVVLYDRALARWVARLLPAGGYAEPLSPDPGADDPAISPRAAKLAADGWSVVQLVEPCRHWRRRLRQTAALGPRDGAEGLPIRLIRKTAAAGRRREETGAPDLPDLLDGSAEDELLTLIVGPPAGTIPAAAAAFIGNGLAG